ncbi:MAG: mannose-6-phosphate isomerase [Clostridiales bacterium]|nr:mannose-6-phosphate isomerase [Clostridiales bacterium]
MPLPPILMYPSYRHGKATPWGGARLRELYHKDIPDVKTGESMEVSIIPGLSSSDAEGTGLSRLIQRYGKALLGTEIKGDFPLLLKLIDAKENLSVQVHPNDIYAQKNENKLGKTEAWVILDARSDSKLVYGIKDGVTASMLGEAAQSGRALEDMLNYVNVSKGDVFYIPAGTVHAIGEGIVLYEIQQSSDITYRFYDWDRRDEYGNKRPLHTRQALDVVNLGKPPERFIPYPLPMRGRGQLEMLLDTPYFSIMRYQNCQGAVLPADRRRFSILTALTSARLHYAADRTLDLETGQTVLLPANGEDIFIDGDELLYSCPAVNS